jgi:hypothetical protein
LPELAMNADHTARRGPAGAPVWQNKALENKGLQRHSAVIKARYLI